LQSLKENWPDPNVEALKVEELPPKPLKSKLTPFQQTLDGIVTAQAKQKLVFAPDPPAPDTRRAEATLATFRALGYVLSARALLLVAVLGGFVLAVMAMLHESPASLYVLVAWCCLTIGPIVALELRRRAE